MQVKAFERYIPLMTILLTLGNVFLRFKRKNDLSFTVCEVAYNY